MSNQRTLLLNRGEVAGLLTADECIDAIEDAFRQYGEGRAAPPAILGVHGEGGGFHIKAGMMEFDGRPYFVAKSNGNFPGNRERGLPTIRGVVLVCDGRDGRVLALMDSIEITILRTGAATAVAAKYLSRSDSRVMTVAGAGEQGRISLSMVSRVRPIDKAYAYDIDPSRARALAHDAKVDFSVTAVSDLREATLASDIVVTCTPSTEWFLTREDVRNGTFIAAVGSDSETKHELGPKLLRDCTLVTDITEQSASIGELHHALEKRVMTRDYVHAELGEIVAGLKPARSHEEEIIVFDSTGMGLQDVAAAVRVYQKAASSGRGHAFVF